ncbi:MAG: hypothetical protein U0169_08500 [Polyangiaceae bacterium]
MTVDGGSRGDSGSAPCPPPTSVVLATEEAPLSLVVDGDHLVWVASAMQTDGSYHRSVRRARSDGNGVVNLHETRRELAAVVAANGDVYWTESDEGGGGGTFRAWDRASGSVRTVLAFDPSYGLLDPFALVADERHAYVVFRADVGPGLRSEYTVWAVPLDGAKPERVARQSLDHRSWSRSMSLRGETAFVGFSAGFLLGTSARERDATARLLLDEVDGLDAWDLSETDLIYAQEGDLRSMPSDGGTTSRLPVFANAYRTVLARNGWIAWGARDGLGAEDVRIRRDDGLVCVLATTDVRSVYGMATDGRHLYWTNTATKAAGGAVVRTELPPWAAP